MNYKAAFNVLGKTFFIGSFIYLLPIIVNFIYGDNLLLSYLVPFLILLAVGAALTFLLKPKDKSLYAKEGFIIVGLCWIVFSLCGAIPFLMSKTLPDFTSALFESASGFTTTGATVFNDVEVLPKSILFFRSLTHFLGGMGVLVFILAVIPEYNEGVMYVFKAESPGPSVSKLVSKIKLTARILYIIYIFLTVLETVILIAGGMPVYDSIVTAMSTAGTGGFGIKNNSIAYYGSLYVEMVIAAFMLLFGINFTVFYLILVGKILKAFKSEELKTYFIIVLLSTLAIALNIISVVGNFASALRYSFFQVAAITSTTGFTSTNFTSWPAFSKIILLFLTVMGGCAGSTGGGLKVSRIIILFKSSFVDVKKMIRPRSVVPLKFEKETLGRETVSAVRTHFIVFMIMVVVSTLIISLDCIGDMTTAFSSVVTCISNVGPCLDNVIGSGGSFADYSWWAKIVFSFNMIAGRLEIFPMLLLFNINTWKKA